MAEHTIVGVDFSGAGTDDSVGGTWVTEGYFDGQVLTIEDCRPISRVGLEIFLKKLRCGSVAALDFPFSIPMSFAKFWQSNDYEMPDLWAAAAAIELDQFRTAVTGFAAEHDFEHLRVGDLLFPNAQPCLHKGYPSMIPMTFRGMQMLHRLWTSGRFQVPPLTAPTQSLPVLLEVMPGAALRNYGLRYTRYKNGSTEAQQQERRGNRKEILSELSSASGLQLEVPPDVRNTCIDYHGADGLDSLVAATVAARWAKCEADFCTPTHEIVTTLKRDGKHKRQASTQAKGMTQLAAARVEGWIYAPKSD